MTVQVRYPMRNVLNKLTVNSERFARYMAQGLSQTEAARRANYGQPTTAAFRLMRQSHIRAAIEKFRREYSQPDQW